MLLWSSLNVAALNSDTIPPAFTTLPQDITVICNSDIEAAFDLWYDSQANAEVDDPTATIFPTQPKPTALANLLASQDSSCSQDGFFELGYFATDSCGNRTDSTYFAAFHIQDGVAPIVVTAATDLAIPCHTGVRDSLQQWLDNFGNATAIDACSDTIIWNNYSWTDSQGNSGFSFFTDSTDIVIDRANCDWEVEVSFFLEDGCGNANVTRANFALSADEEFPIFTFVPSDTTILCNQDLTDVLPIVMDGCDEDITPAVSVSINRSVDSLSCDYFNYEITRSFSAQDACGNSIDTFQIITVRDTIAPEIVAESSIAIDCDADLTDIAMFASAVDDCSSTTLSFRDSTIFNSNCQNQISRKYFATDVCGNTDSLVQIIQVQDFSGPQFVSLPRDTVVLCNTANIESVFNTWLDAYAFTIVEDNCNSYVIRGLDPQIYTDTSIINSAFKPTLQMSDCNNTFGGISTQQISIVAFDVCGNISQSEALFSIVDPQPPFIFNCPLDFELQLGNNECETDHLLTLPQFSDNCLTQAEASWSVLINDREEIITTQSDEIIALEIGVNNITYSITDCGGNLASCEQIIDVRDTGPPIIVCPEDQVVFISDEACFFDFEAPEIVSYEDNCEGVIIFDETIPSVDEFLNFNFNSFFDVYQASDRMISFEDIALPVLFTNPTLTIQYNLNLQDGSTVTISDENGQALVTVSNGDCSDRELKLELSLSQLQRWNSDGLIEFTIINNANTGIGTQPCDPQQISGFQGTDNISFIRINLQYAEVNILTELMSSTSRDTLTEAINLDVGSYQLRYSGDDASQNEGACIIDLEVRDTISPILTCEDITYTIDPLLQDFYPVLFRDLNYESSDNCGVDSTYFFPRQILCSDLDQNLSYEIFVQDESDNISSCIADIIIEAEQLNPEFLSGLCFNDTLKLISNLPPNDGFRVQWTGPNNFSSNLLNPEITNISSSASGTYILTATSTAGCEFSGQVDIDVNEIDSPEIFTSQTTVCNGELVLLNTNSFTEIVEYFWYEGVSPNGTLIGQTDGPSFTVQPLTGTRFYYVEILGNGCNSNPSNTLELLVTPPPLANIPNPFITLCEGDDLSLSTDIFDPDFTYEWTGPNNYSSEGQFPEVIPDVQKANQGTYTLVIKQDVCVSDTATAQVIVFDNPETPVIEGESIFCEGQTAVLTVPNIQNGTRFTWFNNGSFFQSVSSNSLLIPAITNDLSGDWSVIAEEGICSSDTSDIFQVSVETNLNVGATNDGPHCEGDSVLLTSSFIPGATYLWEDPNGLNHNGRIITALAIEGLYTVTITTPSNCATTTTTNVEVGSRPVITALSNTSLPCMSDDMPVTFVPTIFPPGNYQYSWTGPNNFRSNALQPIINNINETDNGTYILEVISGNCNSQPVSTTIDITILPQQAELSGNTDPCEGDRVRIAITNPTSGGQTSWIWNTPFGQITTAIPELTLPNFSFANNGNYSVTQERNGCRSIISEEILVEIQTEPILPIINGTSQLCEDDDLILEAEPADGNVYSWLTPTGTVTTATNRLVITNVSQENAGSYAVFISEGNCESETSVPIQIQITEAAPSVRFEDSNLTLCNTELSEIELCIVERNIDFDLLQLTDLSTGNLLQEVSEPCFSLNFLTATETMDYELTISSSVNGCNSMPIDTLAISILEELNQGAAISESEVYLCQQDFISLTADNIPDNVELLWTTANPEILVFDANEETASFSNLQMGTNLIFLNTNLAICGSSFSDTIQVILQNEIIATEDSYEINAEELTELNPLANDSFDGEISFSIIREPENGSLEIAEMMLIYNSENIFVGTEEIVYELCYTQCKELCSEATITLNVGTDIDCFVGNLITPNGDGYNDLLEIPCLDSGNYNQNSIVIVNQYGDEVFSAAPYTNNWTGQHKGEILPAGTYFYVLNLGDGSKPQQGFITLEL